MRRPLFRYLAIILCGLSGCGTTVPDQTGDSCAISVNWNHTRYVADAHVQATPESQLGTGRTDCGTASDDESVKVMRLRGVRPAVAVGVATEPAVYFAEGYLPALRGHPLHRKIYTVDDRPTGPRRRCRGRFQWNATVLRTPDLGQEIYVRRGTDGSEQFAHLHADTRVQGFARSGLPYVQRGDLIRVTGTVCRPAERPVFRADVIAPSP